MYTLEDFHQEFPDDKACLEWLKNYRWPDGIFCETCQKVTKHHLLKNNRSYGCQYCGNQVYPTANTMFHKSATPLKKWFLVIYLMVESDGNHPIRELGYKLNLSYRTAWRMKKLIVTRLNAGEKFFMADKKLTD